MKKYLPVVFLSLLLVAGCRSQSQNVYTFDEVGQSSSVTFGTVLQSRAVQIEEPLTGVGTLTGGVAGAGVGSAIGGGKARTYSAIGGAVAGAAIGTVIENGVRKSPGVEYTIATEKGKVISVVQRVKKDEPVYANGTRIMLQSSGSFQRVVSADAMPETVKRPKGVKIVD